MAKILIVDDDLALCNLLSRMVTNLGHTPCTALNGVEGERTALAWQPDVILMDVMMPTQNGYITCASLRQKGYDGHIVVVSSISPAQGQSDARLYGADAFLQKPVSYFTLEKYLKTYFQVPVASTEN